MSFEYPQHMFWLRNRKIIFSHALLSGGLSKTLYLLLSTGSTQEDIPVPTWIGTLQESKQTNLTMLQDYLERMGRETYCFWCGISIGLTLSYA